MTEDEIIAEAKRRAQITLTKRRAKVAFMQGTAVRYEAYAEEVARQALAIKDKTQPDVDERTKRARELAAIAYPGSARCVGLSQEFFYRLVDAGCVIVTDEMRGAYENIRREFENCESLLLLDIQRIAPLFAKVKL